MHQAVPTYSHAAQEFYEGMSQATLESDSHFAVLAKNAFSQRGMAEEVERSFSMQYRFSKLLHQPVAGVPRAPMPHMVSRYRLEYFACISALNLHRLPGYSEQLKAELFREQFFLLCSEKEMEWLGVYDADLPAFRQETGHERGQWRTDVIKGYLEALESRSSRDADVLVAVHRFLEHMKLSRSRGLAISPVLLETLAQALQQPAGWLEHYLKFHPL